MISVSATSHVGSAGPSPPIMRKTGPSALLQKVSLTKYLCFQVCREGEGGRGREREGEGGRGREREGEGGRGRVKGRGREGGILGYVNYLKWCNKLIITLTPFH